MNRKQTFRVLNRRSKIKSIINENGGKFFTVKFHKVDGSVRKMNCRTGVTKWLKGGQLSYNPEDKPNLKVVFDVAANDYRTINLDKVFYIKSGGVPSVVFLTEGLEQSLTAMDSTQKVINYVRELSLTRSK